MSSPRLLLESVHRILALIQTVSSDEQIIFNTIVEEAAKVVGEARSELFVLDETGEEIKLCATTDEILKERMKQESFSYKRKEEDKDKDDGKGLTGWIFKTGKPLCIDDTDRFKQEVQLTDDDLSLISDDTQIDDEDKKIKCLDRCGQDKHCEMKRYLGVPVKSQYGEVIGVLRVSSNRKKSVSKQDLVPLQDLAIVISVVLYNEKQKRLKDMLIRLGATYDKEELFQCVVEETPKLILGMGCSIFLLDDDGENLELAYTNSEYLENKTQKKAPTRKDILSYKIGESKTGLVAELKRTLIINYYGTGKKGKEKLEEDKVKPLPIVKTKNGVE
jgi:hypothetical protein